MGDGWKRAVAAAKATRRPHKYGAVATVVDGVRFSSKAEAKRYGELKLLQKAGKIAGLILQPEYALSVATGDFEAPKQIGVYSADFAYETTSGPVVEDVKGMRTPMYRWKKKHVEAQYGITITEVGRK